MYALNHTFEKNNNFLITMEEQNVNFFDICTLYKVCSGLPPRL